MVAWEFLATELKMTQIVFGVIFSLIFSIITTPAVTTPLSRFIDAEDDGVLGEYLVLLQPSLNIQDSVDRVRNYVTGLEGVDVIDELIYNTFGTLRVHSTDSEQLMKVLEQEDVELIEQNRKRKQIAEDGDCVTQDTTGELWGLSRISVIDRPNYPRAKYYYNSGDGAGVDVYVVDTGVYLEHSEFEGRAFWGFTADSVKAEGNSDKNGHGTHVAGTIAGKMFGVAKKATIISVKVLDASGSGTDDDTLKGLIWAADDHKGKSKQSGKNKKSIINMSLGGFSQTKGLVYTQEALIQEIVNNGIPIVAAAGQLPLDSCAFTPSRMSSLITVGATNFTDTLASFSAFGPCVDILAPGVDIKSAAITSPTDNIVKRLQ